MVKGMDMKPTDDEMTRLDYHFRMAQRFESYNAREVKKDRARAWMSALRPVLWLVLALIIAAAAAWHVASALDRAAHDVPVAAETMRF